MADITFKVVGDATKTMHEQPDATHAEAVAAVMVPVAAATVTIANGASLSGAVDLKNARLAGIVLPAAWTAANLTFQTSVDGITYVDRWDRNGGEYTLVVGGAARSILDLFADFIGVRYFKVRSGTTGTPVNQGAERVLALHLVR